MIPKPISNIGINTKSGNGSKMIAFGSYIMVRIGKTNTMVNRCVLVIALKSPNGYGGFYFMNIFNGK